jgi:hypothetical protein
MNLYYYYLVNLKRSKSSPGLVEASCRLPFHVPVRRTGSGMHRLSYIKESDIHAIVPLTLPLNLSSNQPPPPQQQQPQQLSTSSNSLLPTAPLASSISVTSSLNSARPPTINHSVSWSTTTDTNKADTSHVGRTRSLINSDIRNRSNSILINEIEHLKKRLIELEKEDLSLDSIYQQEYLEIENRLKLLEEKQISGGR